MWISMKKLKILLVITLGIAATIGGFLYYDFKEFKSCERDDNYNRALKDLGIADSYNSKDCSSLAVNINYFLLNILRKSESYHVSGMMEVSHFGSSACKSHSYRDIRAGAVVQARSPSGELLSSTTLTQSDENITGCFYTFSIEVPEIDHFYEFQVGRRKINVSLDEVKSGEVSFSIGK